MLLAAAVPVAFIAGTRRLIRDGLRRRLARAVRPGCLAEIEPGRLVRLTGVIAPQPTVPTLFRGIPAVLFRNRLGGADETRGIDFLLDVDGGGQATICVRQALFLDRPTRTREPPACGPVGIEAFGEGRRHRLRSVLVIEPSLFLRLSRPARHESAVAPGDRIEVFGFLHQEAAPDTAGAFDRHVPVRFAVRAGAQLPLVVRRIARPDSSP